MTQQNLIELIQLHHPRAGHIAIRDGLNRAQDDFCSKTEIMKKTFTQTSSAGQRYYELNPDILTIISVQINDVEIPRLIGKPVIDDDEFDSADGLTAPTTSSNDRYWYVDTNRLGVVEKVKNSVTRDDKISDFQSISESKEMRIHAISQVADFTSSMTQSSEIPNQFHIALAEKVISDLNLLSDTLDKHKIFYARYVQAIKDARKYARMRHQQSGTIRQVSF